MLRRALVTPPRQGKGVSCPAHYRLGCVQPCACPLPQRFSVRACEQVHLVQLRDGLRATPSLDVGVAVLFPEQRVGESRRLGFGRCHKVWRTIKLHSQGRQHDFEARRAGQSTPDAAQTKWFHAWLLWRYVTRAHERSDGSTGGDELPEINLLEAPEALLARSLQWYLPHMLRRRVRHARDRNVCCQAVDIGGNCKLSRRICGRDVTEVRHHCGLQ